MKRRRVQAYESSVSFVLEQEAIEPGSTFVVEDLNELYIEHLKSFGIEEKVQATRFTQRLLNSIPNLVRSTVNKNTVVVLFGDKVDDSLKTMLRTLMSFSLLYERSCIQFDWKSYSKTTNLQVHLMVRVTFSLFPRLFWCWQKH